MESFHVSQERPNVRQRFPPIRLHHYHFWFSAFSDDCTWASAWVGFVSSKVVAAKVSEVDSDYQYMIIKVWTPKKEEKNDSSFSLNTFAGPWGCSAGVGASAWDMAADAVSCSSVTFKSSSLVYDPVEGLPSERYKIMFFHVAVKFQANTKAEK